MFNFNARLKKWNINYILYYKNSSKYSFYSRISKSFYSLNRIDTSSKLINLKNIAIWE